MNNASNYGRENWANNFHRQTKNLFVFENKKNTFYCDDDHNFLNVHRERERAMWETKWCYTETQVDLTIYVFWFGSSLCNTLATLAERGKTLRTNSKRENERKQASNVTSKWVQPKQRYHSLLLTLTQASSSPFHLPIFSVPFICFEQKFKAV